MKYTYLSGETPKVCDAVSAELFLKPACVCFYTGMAEQTEKSKPILQIKDLRKVYRMGEECVVALDRINLDEKQEEIAWKRD